MTEQLYRQTIDGEIVPLKPDIIGVVTPVVLHARQVSDTQFIQALAEEPYKIISWADAQAWGSKGVLPQLLINGLDQIKDQTIRNRAYMKAMSAKTYIVDDPWLLQIMQLLPGWDKDKLQQLFDFAATL